VAIIMATRHTLIMGMGIIPMGTTDHIPTIIRDPSYYWYNGHRVYYRHHRHHYYHSY
jgi:hypothetical protein